MVVLEERSRQLMAPGICKRVFNLAGWQLVFWHFEWTCQLFSELHVTQLFFDVLQSFALGRPTFWLIFFHFESVIFYLG